MKDKSKIMYQRAYRKFKNICDANNIKFDTIEITTDQEINLFNVFSDIFWDSRICHVLCKKHFTSNLVLNLNKIGKLSLVTKKSNHFSQVFFDFFESIKLIVLLPCHMIVPMMEFLVEKIENAGIEGIENFLIYLKNKITTLSATRMSFYERITKATNYTHQTTNWSESTNGHLNRFIFSLSKSRKLHTIVRHLRTFFINEYRRVENQYLLKKSDYEPCESAKINFTRARNFVQKINNVGTYPNRRSLKKISLLMEPAYFYGEQNYSP
jgi:hypothetical protein